MQKILVIQTAFIGDVVLATALPEKLHQVFPKANIHFLVRKGNEGLFKEHPYIQKVLIWNKKQHKYRNLLKLWWFIRKQQYDFVINVQRYAATGFLTAFSGAQQKIGFDKNPFKRWYTHTIEHQFDGLHEVERNHALIAHLTDADTLLPKLYPSIADDDSVKHLKIQPYVCIAPSSVWFTKQFPAQKWIELIHRFPIEVAVYLLGAPGDFDTCFEIESQCSHLSVTNLAGELNFLQSASLMRDAMMNYVNDSAPMHFASAVNAPVTAVFCSTIPAFGYGPLSENKAVIQNNEPLSCKPCGIHGHKECPEGHFKCAIGIDTSLLLERLPLKHHPAE